VDKSAKRPKSSKKEVRVEDLPLKDAGKVKGGSGWNLETNKKI
jgi:hypothetical protein